MKLLAFLWHRVLAVLSTALLLVFLLALFLGYRLANFGQTDDASKLSGKRDYLAQISDQQLPATAPNIVFILYNSSAIKFISCL